MLLLIFKYLVLGYNSNALKSYCICSTDQPGKFTCTSGSGRSPVEVNPQKQSAKARVQNFQPKGDLLPLKKPGGRESTEAFLAGVTDKG